MIRNLKALGIALGAVLAMGAVVASSASAIDTFTTSKAPAVITGTNLNTNILKITKKDGGQIAAFECSHAKFAGTVEKSGLSKVTIFATYSGTKANTNAEKCSTSLGETSFDMNECSYDLTGETTGEDPLKGGGTKDATVWISCPAGKEITFTAPLGCTISIHPQTPTEGGAVYTNEKEVSPNPLVNDVKITTTMTGITFSSTAACGLAGFPSEGNMSDYTGTVTATCWEDKGKGAKYDEFVEGAACDLEVSSS